MNFRFFIIIFSTIITLFSCSTPKEIAYFQNLKDASQAELDSMYAQYSAIICPDDLLGITVSSPNLAAVTAYNLPAVSFMSPSAISTGSTQREQTVTMSSLQPYLVDQEGYIDFPVLGRIKLGGLTKKGAVELLEELISKDVKSPLVTIQNLNFKVSVIGEVVKPGPFFLTNGRISILDALSLAGDLTIQGKRDNVLLIRDDNGKKEFHYFDLTTSDVFKSPYFYLQQNDIVYVEPNKPRQKNSKYSQTDQFYITITSTILTAVSILTSLFINLRN